MIIWIVSQRTRLCDVYDPFASPNVGQIRFLARLYQITWRVWLQRSVHRIGLSHKMAWHFVSSIQPFAGSVQMSKISRIKWRESIGNHLWNCMIFMLSLILWFCRICRTMLPRKESERVSFDDDSHLSSVQTDHWIITHQKLGKDHPGRHITTHETSV